MVATGFVAEPTAAKPTLSSKEEQQPLAGSNSVPTEAQDTIPTTANLSKEAEQTITIMAASDEDVEMANTEPPPPAEAEAAHSPPPPPTEAQPPPPMLPPLPTVPQQPATAEEVIIPRLHGISPAIFVPLSKALPSEESLRQSAALAHTDRAEHMRQAMVYCDKHAASVRSNLLTLFRRENARIEQVMRQGEPGFLVQFNLERDEYERQLQGLAGWTSTKEDLDLMFANLAAPAPPPDEPTAAALLGRRTSITSTTQILQQHGGDKGKKQAAAADTGVIGEVQDPTFMNRTVGSPRELAARDGLMLIVRAASQIRGYDQHVSRKRDMRRRALDRLTSGQQYNQQQQQQGGDSMASAGE